VLSRSASRVRCERGQTSAEYLGLVLVVVAIIAAIATTGIGGTIAHGIQQAICSIGGTSCGDGPRSTATAVVPRVGDPRAPSDRDGIDSGPGRGSPTDRGPDGRSGSNGERPRDSQGTAPAPEGGESDSQAPPSGFELGPDGGPAPKPFDPPAPDPGSGKYDSEGAGVRDRLNKEKWYLAADAAETLGYTDAARHLRHYLDNSGKPLEVDVNSILHDEPRLRTAAGEQVNVAVAQALKDYDGSGPADIPFRTGWGVFTAAGKNWFYGLGSMSESVTGVIHIEPGNPPKTTVTYRVHVHDRYNWDGDKSTNIGPFNVKDKELQELHRKGLAQEYDVNGRSDEITVTINPNDPGSATPPAGGGRDGGRSDPGRSRG
jgi:hypothetical protein